MKGTNLGDREPVTASTSENLHSITEKDLQKYL